jgi:hypothetical protein
MDDDEFYELDSLADVDIDTLLCDSATTDLKFRLQSEFDMVDDFNALIGVFYD